MASDETIREQALDWAVQVGDPTFADWDRFMAWLEADPAHARAYDAVSGAATDAAELVVRSAPANDDAAEYVAPPRRRVTWLAGGVAAALALVATVWTVQQGRRDLYTVRTGSGQTHTVALGDGSHVDLAGGTALVLDRKDRRFARLERGQALFTVRHDADEPFEVEVAGERLVDLGTVFDVRHDRHGLSVAVSEGAVSFDPDGAAVRIAPGEILRRPAGSAELVLAAIPREQVGEWREGRLTFQAASLDEVARQLTSATGIAYVAEDGRGRVSGSILVAPLRKDPAAIGPLLGVAVRARGERWVIGTR